MLEDLQLDEAAHDHILLHELVHAATSFAVTRDLRNINQVITPMRNALERELKSRFSEQQMRDAGIKYAFQDNQEFLAEAMSNRALQELMAGIPVSGRSRSQVAMLERGRMPSWWDLFVRAVSDAIGMIRGRRGHSYMEQVLRVYESAAYADIVQTRMAKERWEEQWQNYGPGYEQRYAANLKDALPRDQLDVAHFKAEFGQRVDDVKDWATSGFAAVGRQKLANSLRTLGDLQRRAAELMGGTDNPFQKLGDVLVRKDPLRSKYRKLGERLEIKLAEFVQKHPTVYKALSQHLHEASRFGVDHTVPITHPNNGHISKTGARSTQQRQVHKEFAAEFAQFSPEAQALARELAEHYRAGWAQETKDTVTYVVKAALKTYRVRDKLPAGKTEQDIVDWVLARGAARVEDERTAEDKLYREALGNTADRLADITTARQLKGIYFPLARRGKWFVTATEKLAVPSGAVADPSSRDGNRFLFTDEKKATEYAENSDYLTKLTSYYIDPKTTLRVPAVFQEVDPSVPGGLRQAKRVFVITVQNKRMEMHDNRNTLIRRQRELAAAGHQVSGVALTRQMLEENTHQGVMPSHVETLLRHVEQTAVGSSTIGQQAVQDAIRESAIRAMTTPSALTRRLKRTGQMGYDTDMVSALREYNRSSASHRANMELAPEMADHQADLQKYINDRRRTETGTRIDQLQLLQSELMKRFKELGKPVEETGFSRFADAVMNVSFMRHLFSPHYTIINLLQPLMVTYPVIAAKYGHGAAWRETVRFYRMGGVRKSLGIGLGETWNAARNLNPYSAARITDAQLEGRGIQDQIWFDLVAGETDAKELTDMYDGMIDRGLGAASGLEAGAIAEEDMNTAEKALNRLTTVAKGFPEAAESINRYHTATVAYRLARRAGASIADAQREAWLTVEQTQGGYSRANSPLIFNNPLLRAPLQFKKYGVMYGQLFYGNVAKLVAPSSDPETRKLAAKTLARLSATTMVFAGAGGLPFVELARILANTAVAFGLSDDDWEDWENGMQEWFSSFIGEGASEAVMHGATRVAGIDTSNSLGADNLISFGQPKTLDEEGTLAWIGKMVLGASGGMGIDTVQALGQGDIVGAVPWPKVFKNVTDAIGLFTEGTVSKTTGEQYAPPVGVGGAIVKGLGFQPASSARQWETKGGGRTQREENQEWGRRKALFDAWNKAKNQGNTAEASRVFREDVKAWNRAHKDRKFRIDMGALMRSRKERERERRERQRALQ